MLVSFCGAWRLAIALCLVAASCGPATERPQKEEDTPEEDPKRDPPPPIDEDHPITSLAEVVGVWRLDSMYSERYPEEKIVTAGIMRMHVKANGSYINTWDALSIRIGNASPFDHCTGYSFGGVEFSGGTGIMSDITAMEKRGSCGNALTPPSFDSGPDLSSRYYLAADFLLQKQDLTFEVDGQSEKDTLVAKFRREGTDSWNGTGLDPKLNGKWRLSEMLFESRCLDAGKQTTDRSASPIAFKGDDVLEIDGGRFFERIRMELGGESCDVEHSGSLKPLSFGFEMVTESEYGECFANQGEGDEDAVKPQVLFNGDFFVTGDRMVGLIGKAKTTPDCPGGETTASLMEWARVATGTDSLPPPVECQVATKAHTGCCSSHGGFADLCADAGLVRYDSGGRLMCADGTPSPTCVR